MKVGDLVACERTLNVGKITGTYDYVPKAVSYTHLTLPPTPYV